MKKNVLVFAVFAAALILVSCDPLLETDITGEVSNITESVLAYDANKSLEISIVDSSETTGTSTLDSVSRALEDTLSSTKTEEDLGDGRLKLVFLEIGKEPLS